MPATTDRQEESQPGAGGIGPAAVPPPDLNADAKPTDRPASIELHRWPATMAAASVASGGTG
jgi:hypothetical protein